MNEPMSDMKLPGKGDQVFVTLGVVMRLRFQDLQKALDLLASIEDASIVYNKAGTSRLYITVEKPGK